MALSADMHARIFGPRPLNQLFAPYGSGDRITWSNLLPTLPSSIEPQVTSAFHKLGWVEREPDAGAAGGGAHAARSARDLRATRAAGNGARAHAVADATSRGAHASQAAHGAEAVVTTSNPVYGGLLAQRMYADAGLPLPRYVPPAGGAAAHVDDVAGVVDDVAGGVPHEAAAAATGAAATAGAPATAAERSMMSSFELLSTLDEPQRIEVLSGALEHRFAAGKGPSTLEVLTRAVIDGPFEDSAPAMQHSLERVLAGGAADVAAATAKAAPAATETVAHAAPAAAEVVEHAAPVFNDAVIAARAMLRGGGPGQLCSMEHGIIQAHKLLR
jgi:hypothetical protein